MVPFGGSEFEFWRPRWPNLENIMQMLLLEMPCGQKCSRMAFWRSKTLCNGYVGSSAASFRGFSKSVLARLMAREEEKEEDEEEQEEKKEE